jgi:dihydroflavonol-4-reductase
MKPRKVLVTGGNGHVGNTLAKKLCEKGYDVRVTVRNPEEVEAFGIFDGYQVDLRQADIRDETAVKKAMEGVSGVFQVAAVYNYDERSLGEGIVANNKEGSGFRRNERTAPDGEKLERSGRSLLPFQAGE